MITKRCILKLGRDVTVCRVDDELSFQSPVHGSVPVRAGSSAIASALMRLREGAAEDELAGALPEPEDVARLYYILLTLQRSGLLEYWFAPSPELRLVVRPVAKGLEFTDAKLKSAGRYVLSRTAYLRRDGEHCVLESPVSRVRIEVDGWGVAAAVALLARPAQPSWLAAALGMFSKSDVFELLELLLRMGFLREASRVEDEVPRAWEFHDLLFHGCSRLGRNTTGFGGTFRLRGQIPEPQPLKTPPEGEPIPLYRPDLAKLAGADQPFTRVLESRRSLRQAGEPPVTARQLGEFLYRVAHIQQQGDGWILRNYPSAGALHELEIYPLVRRCSGIEAGLYYYRSPGHALYRLPAGGEKLAALFAGMDKVCGAVLESPQVILVITARFERVAWKYAGIAYRNTLLNTGILLQTMYLVAAAMCLAPCAMGGGAPEEFAQAAALTPLIEDSVGEFALSSHPVAPAS
jgi:SagB-type dehydrogenase family enzyme